MRNLKKILALVLALVMSLSLMATAGAESFKDVTDDNPYKTAIDVLTELKVVKGYGDGNFQPDGQLNRAEAAVLVYRIATGDVEDKYLDNYTFMQQSKFTDLDGYNWAKGYINYCQNAGIVVGTDATHFNPGGKVTGYQLLVMLLRTLGYGKAGEFADPKGWELQTAAIAEREGITANVTTGDFGAPAPRAMVAELLFRGLLTETVTYSALVSGGYTKGQTLGMREFKLEEIEGVVTGNEFADLYSNQVLPEGRTNLEVAEDDIRSLAISTEITDIGESRYAYITGSKVLAMGDTGNNKVTETGAAVDISSNSKFNAVSEMTAASDIEYYIDFDNATSYDCDYRLEFNVVFYSAQALRTFNSYARVDMVNVATNDGDWTVEVCGDLTADPLNWSKITAPYAINFDTDGDTVEDAAYRFTKIIYANHPISTIDLRIIEGIFGAADNVNNNLNDWNKVTGDVYVGTKSTAANVTGDERDLSNLISYNKFVEDYINIDEDAQYWNQSYNGDWVKFVDNNGDGKAEYAFLTNSWLDEAIGAYTNKDDQTITEFIRFDDDNDPRAIDNGYQTRYLNDYTPAVGDKVVCAQIDNQILVAPAESENVTVSDYSWREDKITTDKGEYGQSGIGNATDMQQRISGMEDNVEYTVYFDHFGYVRAYELPGGTQYALLTELYYTNGNYGNLVQNWPMIAELKVGEAEKKEYGTSSSNVFNTQQFLNTPWLEVRSIAANRSYYNWLQPAIAHLGVGYTDGTLGWRGAMNGGVSTVTDPALTSGPQYTFWDKNYQAINTITNFGTSQEFRYGTQTYASLPGGADAEVNNTTSFTNVAVVNVNDDENTATLSGAAKLHVDRNGRIDPTRYDVDYIQLSTADIAKGAVRYDVYDAGNVLLPNGTTGDYRQYNNYFVNAVHDTEYYIVYNGDVFYCKDYVNFPGLTNKDNNIHAAYAVARDTRADNAGAPYWVADVIVYEVESLDDTTKSNIALAYYTQQRNTGAVQLLKTLNSKVGPMVDLVPGGKDWNAELGQWGNALLSGWENYGFYQLYNATEPVDGQMSARAIDAITKDFNKNGIYAGTIIREVDVDSRGDYIVVEIEDGTGLHTVQVEVTDKIYAIERDVNVDGNWYNEYNTARQLRYKNTNSPEVKTGDRVIWVGSANTNGTRSSASFVVDLGNWNTNWDLWNTTARFLAQYAPNPTTDANPTSGLWKQIIDEQAAKYVAPEYVDINMVLAANETAVVSVVDGSSATIKGDGDPAGQLKTLTVPGQQYSFTLNIKLTSSTAATVTLGAVTVGGGWTAGVPVMNSTNTAGTEKTYTVLVSRTTLPTALSASFVPASEADLRVYSAAGAKVLADWAKTPANLTALSDAEIVALGDILTDLNTAITANDAVDAAVKTAVGDAKTAVDAKVGEIESAAGEALTAAKAGLDDAITTLIDGQESADITAAKEALTTAIGACETAAEVEAYYKVNDGGLVLGNDLVKALADAVKAAKDAAAEANKPLTDAKAAAVAAVEKLVGNKTSTEITAAKKALVDAINACAVLEADGNTPSSKVLATYWDTTAEPAALVNENDLVTALNEALEDAEADVALKTAKLDAIEAVDKLIGTWSSEAITSARTTLVNAINGCENATALAEYWTNGKLVDGKLTALKSAIADAKKVTAIITALTGATVKSGAVEGSDEDAGKYTVTIAEAGASSNVVLTIAAASFSEITEEGANKDKFKAEATFTVTGGAAATSTEGATLPASTTGAYTLTVILDAAAETDVTVAITAPSAT